MHSDKFIKQTFTEMRVCSSLRPRLCMFEANNYTSFSPVTVVIMSR